MSAVVNIIDNHVDDTQSQGEAYPLSLPLRITTVVLLKTYDVMTDFKSNSSAFTLDVYIHKTTNFQQSSTQEKARQ